MDTLLSFLGEELSPDLFIYAAMAILLIPALINHRGKGLLHLWGVSQALNRAAKKLRHEAHSALLRSNILSGEAETASAFFSSKCLRKELLLYAEAIRASHVTEADQCQLDIGTYFNTDLLEQEGSHSYQEHVTTGLNALGILGTFLGLIMGLQNFKTDTAETISESIRVLMGGMGTAFNTSLVGISLSLLYGTIYRAAYSRAEKKLDLFLEEFRRNVLCDQRQSSINHVVDKLTKLDNQIALNSEESRSEFENIAHAIVDHMGECLTEQINEMRSAMEASTAQQIACNEKIGEMIGQLDMAKERISQLGSSFSTVIDQSRLLADQIAASTRTVHEEVNTLSSVVSADAAILEKQQEAMQRMDNYATAMASLGIQVAQQSTRTAESITQVAQCSQSVILDSQTALESQLRTIMLAASDLNQALTNQSMNSMAALQQQMEQMIRTLPTRSADGRCLETMVRQNATIIENQQRLLALMEHGSTGSGSEKRRRLKWPSRK